MDGDLLRPTLRGDVLSVGQQRPASIAAEADEILGDERNRASRALLPRRVGRGVDDHLPDDSPAGVMGIATRHQEPRECVRHILGFGLGAVDVEMAQRGADVSAVVNRPRQLPSGLRSLSFGVDPLTVAARRSTGRD